MKFLEELAARRSFGMKPGLDTIRGICGGLGDPQKRLRGVVHVAGTNGKGAVCALLDSALRQYGSVGRYTSPHLVKLNERFFRDGWPIDDSVLERAASRIAVAGDMTFFEALTAVAFLVYAEIDPDHVVLETGLGGRLDATNVCEPELCVITKIGLDHCDWLGDTVTKIAAEKAGIIKPGVPVVLGRNESEVIEVVRRYASERGAPFHYAPDLVEPEEVPAELPLRGAFNRENAVTALAALEVLGELEHRDFRRVPASSAFAGVVWPGRFHQVGRFLIDGAHNPPAAKALAESLREISFRGDLVFGACGDKDVREVLSQLKPFISRGYAVKTNNPRSLSAEATAAIMNEVGIGAVPATLDDVLMDRSPEAGAQAPSTLVCGSLFLAGEALVALGAYPWGKARFDPSEKLRV